MTRTSIPAEHISEPAPGDTIQVQPADVLLNLIVILLAPMFIDASGGNIAFARMAALETVNAYRIRHNADLIAVAQIIAFGLAALGSLCLSMVDDISLSMTLRLRGNANALNRSAEQNRRALQQHQGSGYTQQLSSDTKPSDGEYEVSVMKAVAALQPDATPPREPEPAPAAAPSPAPLPAASAPAASAPAASAPAASAPTQPSPAGQPQQAMWAAAMAKVAAEVAASLPGLPPQERRVASMRAAALSSTANELMCRAIPPRPRPGDLDAMFPPKAA